MPPFKLSDVLDILKNKLPDLQAVYLFGSTGTQFETQESDLDIAIYTKGTLSAIARWELSQEIAQFIRKEVDLVDLKEASTVLRFEIVSSGERVWCADSKWCDLFETLVYSAYVRFNDERREILEDIQKRGNILNG